jgi:hypothetical protein
MMGVLAAATGLVDRPIEGVRGVYSLTRHLRGIGVIDTQQETYSILGATNRCLDYGEYPASEGICSTFVTFATVKDSATGHPSAVTVRSFAL